MDEADLLHVRWRSRRDLQLLPDPQGGVERWRVFDPLSRESYRVGAIEHWCLSQTHAPRSLTELLTKLRNTQPALAVDQQTFVERLRKLQHLGLMSTTPSHGDSDSHLASQRATQPALRRKQPSSWFTPLISKLVAWQVRGINPERLFQFLAPRSNLFFARSSVICWLSLAALTLFAVLLDADRLLRDVGAFEWLFNPTQGGLLFVVFILTRGLHELGHGLVCTRYGIRCPDLGLFFILGAPCVYCDVSESWKLVDRRQRAAVAAAGMYAELLVAMAAAWVWLITTEGAAHTLAMQVMCVCSLGTILINANPLMKFDGYYILADWLDEANLRSRADTTTLDRMRQLLGSAPRKAQSLSTARRRFFILFSLASAVYRIVLSFTIAGVLLTMFSHWQIAWVGRLLAVAMLGSWWGSSIVNGLRFFASRFQRPLPAITWSALLALLVTCAMLWPLPNRQFAKGWVEPQRTHGIYAPATARLEEVWAANGNNVVAGEKLLQLKSTPMELQLAAVRREVARQEVKLVHATFQRAPDFTGDRSSPDPEVARQTRRLLDDATQQLERLTLTAPISGRLIAFPASQPTGPWSQAMHQPAHALTPIDWFSANQLGRTVPQGTLLAAVCSDEQRAVVVLDKEQLGEVTVGTAARVRLSQQPQDVFSGQVSAIVELNQRDSMWRPVEQTPGLKDSSSTYAALIELPPTANSLPGGSVDVVFIGKSATLVTYLRRWGQVNLKQLAD